MLKEEEVKAFLALLLDHYVRQVDVHTKLKPTKAAEP